MSYNLPNPSLVGILLAVSTHNGPQIIFSYPKHLKSSSTQCNPLSDDDDFDDEDYEAAEFQAPLDSPRSNDAWNVQHSEFYLGSKLDLLSFLDARDKHMKENKELKNMKEKKKMDDSIDDHSFSSSDKSVPKKAEKSTVVGLELDQLSELLCPPRAMCNRRFDMVLENHVFLGLPMHVNRHGVWRERKHQASKKTMSDHASNQKDDSPEPNPKTTETSSHSSTALTMFHLVFVMDPANIERNYRVDEMFYNVVSKLSLVLRYEQHKNNYVGSQVQQVFKLKEQWRGSEESGDLTGHLVQRSAMCRMMADCYHSLRESKISSLNINGKLRSFQIPIKMEFLSLPDSTVPYIPGSYLSSTSCVGSGQANLGETSRYNNSNKFLKLLLGNSLDRADPDMDFDQEDEDSADRIHSNPDDIIYLALLLWDEPEQIIKDIKADPRAEIAKFIKLITPTESLLRIFNTMQVHHESQLDLSQIKSFALHLVYWRRARVIPPLSTRSIYIVSPMAPLSTNFVRDVPKFAQMFPTVPSLPSFLKLLSTRTKKPRQFASIIPSRDHKDMYLLALSWLVRFGYVTQLHTYIWLKVSKKVKMNVEEELEEELSRNSNKGRKEPERDTKVDNTSKKANSVDNTSKKAASVDNTSKQSQKPASSIEDEISRIQKKLEASHSLPDIVLESDGDTILVDPGRASALERRWLDRIVHTECNLSPDLTTVFYRLLKYMNGKNSLEFLLLRENVSRSDLRRLLLAIEDHIISVRHW